MTRFKKPGKSISNKTSLKNVAKPFSTFNVDLSPIFLTTHLTGTSFTNRLYGKDKINDAYIGIPLTVSLNGNWRSAGWLNNCESLIVAHSLTPFVSVIHDITSGLPNIGSETLSPALETAASKLRISPDGKYVAFSFATSPYIRIYDLTTSPISEITAPATLPTGEVSSMAWSPDSRYLAVTMLAAPGVYVYDLQTGTPVKLSDPASPPNGTTCNGASWSPSGNQLCVMSGTSPYIYLYTFNSGTLTKVDNPTTLPPALAWGATAFSPDGNWIICGSTSNVSICVYDNSVSPPVRTHLLSAIGGAARPSAIGWTNDGRYVVTGGSAGKYITVYSFDYANGTLSAVAGTTASDGLIAPHSTTYDLLMHPYNIPNW